MDRHELAWAAGFFDGDGWAGFSGALDRRTRQPHAQINQAGETGVPETLERFRNSVDCAGHLGGPVVLLGRLPMYSWTASSRSDVEHVWDLLSPWLCDSKSAEFRAALRLPLDTAWARTRTPEDLAWAAGLFDAEGSTSLLKHRSHEGYLIPELAITQASNLGVPGELTRFQRAVSGRGRIYGPFTQKRARRPVYR